MSRRSGRAAELTRREWARWIGATSAGAALGCGDNRGASALVGAVLEPTSTSLLVAIWSRDATEVDVEVTTGEEVLAIETVELGDGGVGVLDVTDLVPDRAYEIAFVTGPTRFGPCRARTAPSADATAPVRIAVSADFDPNPMFDSDLIDHVLAAEPQLFISLGDFPYTDNGPIAQTVGEYRTRHADLRTAPAARRLLEGIGIRAIYDDHEFRNDWDTARAEVEASRYAAAMQVWDEFFPLRDPADDVRYRSWRWGRNLECFLLDCRRFRSANSAPDDATKTMLGATQYAWLVDEVRRSTATFKLVLTSVPLDFGMGFDHWSGFQTERARLLAAMVGVPGVVFMSADQHYFAAHRHAHGVREFQVGPLARGVFPPGPVAPGVLFRSHQYNAGLIDVSSDRFVISGLGADGERFYEEVLTVENLTPG
jgi:phosphodiesterase/alkaline phosphatase D-like protein